jgi:hypothetical protein
VATVVVARLVVDALVVGSVVEVDVVVVVVVVVDVVEVEVDVVEVDVVEVEVVVKVVVVVVVGVDVVVVVVVVVRGTVVRGSVVVVVRGSVVVVRGTVDEVAGSVVACVVVVRCTVVVAIEVARVVASADVGRLVTGVVGAEVDDDVTRKVVTRMVGVGGCSPDGGGAEVLPEPPTKGALVVSGARPVERTGAVFDLVATGEVSIASTVPLRRGGASVESTSLVELAFSAGRFDAAFLVRVLLDSTEVRLASLGWVVTGPRET